MYMIRSKQKQNGYEFCSRNGPICYRWFRFGSEKIYKLETPTATIGIRGTDFTTTVDELGRSLVILLPDENCDDRIKLEYGCKPQR